MVKDILKKMNDSFLFRHVDKFYYPRLDITVLLVHPASMGANQNNWRANVPMWVSQHFFVSFLVQLGYRYVHLGFQSQEESLMVWKLPNAYRHLCL